MTRTRRTWSPRPEPGTVRRQPWVMVRHRSPDEVRQEPVLDGAGNVIGHRVPTGTDPYGQPTYQFVPLYRPPAGAAGRAPTIINYPGYPESVVGKNDAQAEAAAAAAALARARAESGLYDAQTLKVLAEIEALKLKMAAGDTQAAAELAQKRVEFETQQRSTDAARAQQQAQFEATLRDQAAARAQASAQRAAEFGVTATGYYGGAPTLEREQLLSVADRQNLQTLADMGVASAKVQLEQDDQRQRALDQERRFGLDVGQATGYYGGQATLARERQQADIAMQRGRAALDEGNAAEARRQFDIAQRLREKTQADEVRLAEGGQTGYLNGQRTLAGGQLDLSRQAQQFAQDRDPYSAWQKLSQLREGAPAVGAPAVGAPAVGAPAGGASATLQGVFGKGGQGGFGQGGIYSPLAPLSAQARMAMLPSERRIRAAGELASGIAPEDADEIARRLTETGAPSLVTRTIARPPVTAGSLY